MDITGKDRRLLGDRIGHQHGRKQLTELAG